MCVCVECGIHTQQGRKLRSQKIGLADTKLRWEGIIKRM